MPKPLPTPQDMARKWSTNLGAAGESIRAGVNRVQEAPNAAAARQERKYLQRVQDAVNSGKFRERNNAVTLDMWRQAMLNKGLARIPAGAQAGIPKMERFAREYLPFLEGIRNEVLRMPNGTEAERTARLMRMHELLKTFRRVRQFGPPEQFAGR